MIDVETERVISVADAGRMLAMSAGTIKRHILAGRLDGFKAGGHWRTSVQALNRFLDHAEPPPDAATPAQARRVRDTEKAWADAVLDRMGV